MTDRGRYWQKGELGSIGYNVMALLRQRPRTNFELARELNLDRNAVSATTSNLARRGQLKPVLPRARPITYAVAWHTPTEEDVTRAMNATYETTRPDLADADGLLLRGPTPGAELAAAWGQRIPDKLAEPRPDQ